MYVRTVRIYLRIYVLRILAAPGRPRQLETRPQSRDDLRQLGKAGGQARWAQSQTDQGSSLRKQNDSKCSILPHTSVSVFLGGEGNDVESGPFFFFLGSSFFFFFSQATTGAIGTISLVSVSGVDACRSA